MKRGGILNRDVSALVARLGHLDEITLCDAGLPCPPGAPVIDLSLRLGTPPLWDVLETLREELVIEGVIWAEETAPDLAAQMSKAFEDWANLQAGPIATSRLSHDAFKARTASSRAILRTGDITPYANVVLICGVAF